MTISSFWPLVVDAPSFVGISLTIPVAICGMYSTDPHPMQENTAMVNQVTTVTSEAYVTGMRISIQVR